MDVPGLRTPLARVGKRLAVVRRRSLQFFRDFLPFLKDLARLVLRNFNGAYASNRIAARVRVGMGVACASFA